MVQKLNRVLSVVTLWISCFAPEFALSQESKEKALVAKAWDSFLEHCGSFLKDPNKLISAPEDNSPEGWRWVLRHSDNLPCVDRSTRHALSAYDTYSVSPNRWQRQLTSPLPHRLGSYQAWFRQPQKAEAGRASGIVKVYRREVFVTGTITPNGPTSRLYSGGPSGFVSCIDAYSSQLDP